MFGPLLSPWTAYDPYRDDLGPEQEPLWKTGYGLDESRPSRVLFPDEQPWAKFEPWEAHVRNVGMEE